MAKPTLKKMRDFLKGHFRYHTMNSWNLAHSYAAKVKFQYLDIPREDMETAYDLLGAQDAEIWDTIRFMMEDFAEEHYQAYQLGFNGRSNGYIVLYHGGRKPSGYKTRCDTCGKLTWYETAQGCHMDKCPGTLRLITGTHMQTYSSPGESMECADEVDDMDTDSLRTRYKLVKEFDTCVARIVAEFKDYARKHRVEDKTIMVPRTIRVAVER